MIKPIAKRYLAWFRRRFEQDEALPDPVTILNGLASNGWSALHFAVRYESPRMAYALLRSGADPNARSAADRTPLFYAPESRYGRTMVKMLLDAGADPRARDETGAIPLHYAAKDGARGTLALLLEAGADPNAKDEFGRSIGPLLPPRRS